MSTAKNKRIAKNTAMLYIRMLFILGVSLYTSRIVLNTLGVEDYGIFNVVGGVISMFSFLSGAMSRSVQRFISFELGKGNYDQLKKVFAMSMNALGIIALIILVLSETVGLWFLNNKLIIPSDRMVAANWVYQFSIFSFLVLILSVPYNALIIAHEKMNVYAYVSIVEVILKLLIVFMLQWFGYDKLKLYAVLIFTVSLLVRIIYGLYSKRNFEESKYFFYWDKKLFKTLLSFTGWNLWGNAAVVMYSQGINILLNIFFGPAINASRGIAYQINSAVSGFVGNFLTAMNPQIVKSYAEGDIKYMHNLLRQGAKYSFFLLYFLSLPILLETEIVLKIWLKTVPDYTVIFSRLVLINLLIASLSEPLVTAAQASGKIKIYQITVGGLLLLILPVSYVFLKNGFPPQSTLYITIFFTILVLFARLSIVRNLISLSIRRFLIDVIFPVSVITVLALIIPLSIFNFMHPGIIRFLIIVFTSGICVLISVYFFGIGLSEKKILKSKIRYILKGNNLDI